MYELKAKQKIFIYTGPDGSGRRTLAKMVATAFDMESVLSYTTRPIKSYEKDGEDYHFVTKETFEKMAKNHEFLEQTQIDDFHYGIREQDIIDAFREHKLVYLTLNQKGADLVKEVYGDKVVRIFVYANRDTVELRQKQRGDDEEAIQSHMNHYEETMQYKDECEHSFENYDLPQVSFQISELIEQYLQRDLIVDEY
jgi:guanylate kinase